MWSCPRDPSVPRWHQFQSVYPCKVPSRDEKRSHISEIRLGGSSNHMLSARCGCAAGMGQRASCKHIVALCYALVEFTKVSTLPEFITCTNKLVMESTMSLQAESSPSWLTSPAPTRTKATKETISDEWQQFDPHPESTWRLNDPKACEKLWCRLLALKKPCAFLHILVPNTDKIFHNHNYAQRPCDKASETVCAHHHSF